MIFKRKCKITFIRHGATINTEENRLFDDENYPAINVNGKAEMEKIAKWVKEKGLKIDKIYSSSALRCVQSSEIFAKICGAEFEVSEDLTARKFGVWSGLSFEEIEEKYPHMLDEYHKNPETYKPDGGETVVELNNRIKNAINSIIEKNTNKRIFIVTHGDVIQSAISNILEVPVKNQYKIFVPTGSATQINYFEDFATLVYSSQLPL